MRDGNVWRVSAPLASKMDRFQLFWIKDNLVVSAPTVDGLDVLGYQAGAFIQVVRSSVDADAVCVPDPQFSVLIHQFRRVQSIQDWREWRALRGTTGHWIAGGDFAVQPDTYLSF